MIQWPLIVKFCIYKHPIQRSVNDLKGVNKVLYFLHYGERICWCDNRESALNYVMIYCFYSKKQLWKYLAWGLFKIRWTTAGWLIREKVFFFFFFWGDEIPRKYKIDQSLVHVTVFMKNLLGSFINNLVFMLFICKCASAALKLNPANIFQIVRCVFHAALPCLLSGWSSLCLTWLYWFESLLFTPCFSL